MKLDVINVSLMVLVATLTPSAIALSVTKSWGYKSFSVTSTKLKKEMSDTYVAANLMCRSTKSSPVASMDLLQNYDLIGTTNIDGIVSTYFKGKQSGSRAIIMFLIDPSTNILKYVYVNDMLTLRCW